MLPELAKLVRNLTHSRSGWAQRRAAERGAYEAHLAACASRQILDRLTDKWVFLVLCGLHDHEGPFRYSQLSRRIAGASQKMLTQTLRNLERDGLVERQVEPTVPVTVRTPSPALGASIIGPIQALKRWSESHIDEIDAARRATTGKPAAQSRPPTRPVSPALSPGVTLSPCRRPVTQPQGFAGSDRRLVRCLRVGRAVARCPRASD